MAHAEHDLAARNSALIASTPPPAARRPAISSRFGGAHALLLVTTGALALVTALRLPSAWESGNALNHVSGAWMALAEDLAHGTFYRELHDPALGYGGTRFFPLVFGLHAGLRALGVDLLTAGYALSLAAGLLVVAGAFAFLRAVGLARPTAAAFAVLSLAAFATQYSLASMRGDLLPVALGALGLATVARGPTRARLLAGGALFVLAFAAKPTALTAPAAAVLWLALRRERRPALALAGGVAAGAVAVVAVTELLSAGRFLTILSGTALGGAELLDLVRAPVRLVRHVVVEDPAAVGLVGAAIATTLAGLRSRMRALRRRKDDPALLAALWLVAALGAVVLVYASPGTGVNHLVEVEVAAAVALGAAWAGRGTPVLIARALAPVAAAVGLTVALGSIREDRASSRLAELRAIGATIPPGASILSEDPLVPLVRGERPVVLDPWMLRLAAERDPSLDRELVQELRRRSFGAVVLFRDLSAPGAQEWYDRGNLGLELVREIARGYRLAASHGHYRLYLPKPPRTAPPDERPRVADRPLPLRDLAPDAVPAATSARTGAAPLHSGAP